MSLLITQLPLSKGLQLLVWFTAGSCCPRKTSMRRCLYYCCSWLISLIYFSSTAGKEIPGSRTLYYRPLPNSFVLLIRHALLCRFSFFACSPWISQLEKKPSKDLSLRFLINIQRLFCISAFISDLFWLVPCVIVERTHRKKCEIFKCKSLLWHIFVTGGKTNIKSFFICCSEYQSWKTPDAHLQVSRTHLWGRTQCCSESWLTSQCIKQWTESASQTKVNDLNRQGSCC